MTKNSHFQVKARKQVENPALWRPEQYDDTPRSESVLWLDRGECLDPELTNIVMEEFAQLSRSSLFAYPTPGPLYRKLSKFLEIPVNYLQLTRGSDGAIKSVFETFVSPNDKVVLSNPTYQMYMVYAQMYGAEPVTLDYTLENGRLILDVSAFAALIADTRPKLVCLPNPDNPTGVAFPESEIIRLIETAYRSGSIILIDEAYFPFYDLTVMPFVQKYENLIVARTFSKAWGMAGIRLGYTVAQPDITFRLNKVRTMVEADGVSMELALRMLDRTTDVERSIDRLIEGRKFFANKMNGLGFHAIETAGNFVHVDFGAVREDVEEALKPVARYRVFPVPPLENFLRFTTTTVSQFEAVIHTVEPFSPLNNEFGTGR